MDSTSLFDNRQDAGIQLAKQLLAYRDDPNAMVLALPRGGVPVGHEIAKKLHIPLDVFIVRKLGVPYQEELAMGAIASGGVILLNQTLINELNISQQQIDLVKQHEIEELKRRELRYRKGNPLPNLDNKNIILVDDGIATGFTIKAAITALKKLSPRELIIATPVAPADTLDELKPMVNAIYCLQTPTPFYGIGQFYADFSQTTDEQVCQLLEY